MLTTNKLLYVSILVLVVAVGAISFVTLFKRTPVASPSVVLGDSTEVAVPVTATNYAFTSATIKYQVTKRWLTKPITDVVGVSSAITGNGWFDKVAKKGFVTASLDFSSLQTDTPKRDADVLKMLKASGINVEANFSELALNLGENKVLVPVKIAFNGVFRSVDFETTVTLAEDGSVTAVGTATQKISDFGITPPNMAGLYTVDDAVVLSFEVVGSIVK